MACGDQPAEGAQQFCDVLEMQARCRLIEEEQFSADGRRGGFRRRPRRRRFFAGRRSLRQVSCEFQALRFAAGQCRHGLAQTQIFEPDFRKRRKHALHFRIRGEKFQRL